MSLGHGASIVRDGLVLHLDAANVKSYPGSGTTWYDLSGRNNNGTLENSPTFNSAQNGYISLDGVNDRIVIPNTSGDFNLRAADFSVSIWIRQFDTPAQYPHLFTFNDQSLFTLKAVRPDITDSFRLYVYQGSAINFTNSFLINNTWQAITFVRQDTAHKLYINGTLLDNVTATKKDITAISNMYIGWGWASEYTRQDRGALSLYNKALTDEEITKNFEAMRGRYGI